MPEIILLSSTETIALIRDIFVIVFLSLGFVALVVFLVFALSLYRRITRFLDAAEAALTRLDGVAEIVENIGAAASRLGGILSLGGVAGRVVSRFRRR